MKKRCSEEKHSLNSLHLSQVSILTGAQRKLLRKKEKTCQLGKPFVTFNQMFFFFVSSRLPVNLLMCTKKNSAVKSYGNSIIQNNFLWFAIEFALTFTWRVFCCFFYGCALICSLNLSKSFKSYMKTPWPPVGAAGVSKREYGHLFVFICWTTVCCVQLASCLVAMLTIEFNIVVLAHLFILELL